MTAHRTDCSKFLLNVTYRPFDETGALSCMRGTALPANGIAVACVPSEPPVKFCCHTCCCTAFYVYRDHVIIDKQVTSHYNQVIFNFSP